MRNRFLVAMLGIALLGAAACSSSSSDTAEAEGAPVAAITSPAAYRATGSVHGAYVLGATKGEELILTAKNNREVARATADDFGSVVYYDVNPGAGYTVRHVDGTAVEGSEPFRVLSEKDTPDPALYRQELKPGLNYIKMRDGVELAMTLRLPQGKQLADGPFPTLIEYSGYQVAAPGDLLGSITAGLTGGKVKDDPLVPATSTFIGSLLGPVLGYATVSVQMRGSGCSGGAFDLFDWPTVYDGYDAVETVAAQPWVKGNKVGMVGISFSGISQLLTGGTKPPHLAAVTPLSPTDDLYRNVGSPGGIFNRGFAKSWLDERANDAKPAPDGGQPYAKELVKQGDQHCTDNQKLRLQTRDAMAILAQDPTRNPATYDHREPGRWGANIEVPVFLSSAFQDEQIIGAGPQLVEGLYENPNVWVTLLNGTHVDPLGPAVLSRWAEFLSLYVNDAPLPIPDLVLSLGGAIYQEIAKAPGGAIQQNRFVNEPNVEAARTKFREDPRVRVLMDNGAGDLGPGALQTTWELGFDNWPPKDAKATAFYLGPGGKLTSTKPTGDGADRYTGDPTARPETSLPSGDAWNAQPPYQWKAVADGKSLGYVSEPLAEDIVVAGPSSLDLTLASSAPDTDLQVTLSEVRPDGKENYVQFGLLRASYRKLGKNSTDLQAIPTYTAADRANLAPGEPVEVRVPLYPVAYPFRKGSRIRITVQAPGGERPAWKFDTIEKGTTENTISWSAAKPSKIVLPVIPGMKAGAPLPPCGALRGTPCRDYVAAANGG